MVAKPPTPEVRMPEPAPPAPERSDAQTEALAEAQRAKFSKNRGRASTFFGSSSERRVSSAGQFLGGA